MGRKSKSQKPPHPLTKTAGDDLDLTDFMSPNSPAEKVRRERVSSSSSEVTRVDDAKSEIINDEASSRAGEKKDSIGEGEILERCQGENTDESSRSVEDTPDEGEIASPSQNKLESQEEDKMLSKSDSGYSEKAPNDPAGEDDVDEIVSAKKKELSISDANKRFEKRYGEERSKAGPLDMLVAKKTPSVVKRSDGDYSDESDSYDDDDDDSVSEGEGARWPFCTVCYNPSVRTIRSNHIFFLQMASGYAKSGGGKPPRTFRPGGAPRTPRKMGSTSTSET